MVADTRRSHTTARSYRFQGVIKVVSWRSTYPRSMRWWSCPHHAATARQKSNPGEKSRPPRSLSRLGTPSAMRLVPREGQQIPPSLVRQPAINFSLLSSLALSVRSTRTGPWPRHGIQGARPRLLYPRWRPKHPNNLARLDPTKGGRDPADCCAEFGHGARELGEKTGLSVDLARRCPSVSGVTRWRDGPFGRAQRSVHQSKRASEQGGWQHGPHGR
jgi:hypothetical protein